MRDRDHHDRLRTDGDKDIRDKAKDRDRKVSPAASDESEKSESEGSGDESMETQEKNLDDSQFALDLGDLACIVCK